MFPWVLTLLRSTRGAVGLSVLAQLRAQPSGLADGGTGATTAGAALINLGGTTTGISIFTAATQQAAWTALGVAPSGVVNGGTY